MEDAITTKNKIIMNEEFLFAVDFTTEEVIVSYSSKGTNKIMIFNAAVTLKSISESSDFDPKLFKMMDKVCQSIYNKLRESTQ